MTESSSEPPTETDTSQEGQAAAAEFDNYRSLGDPNLMIFVAKKCRSAFPFQSWRLGVATIVDRTWPGNESPYCRKRIL
jgi:hypothetical protein